MKICVVSDSHDRSLMLASAVIAAKVAGAEAVIHCGDLIGAMTLRPLLDFGLPVHVVHGNNLGDSFALLNLCKTSNGLITYHGADMDITLSGRRLFATHFPHYGRGMACTGDYDIVCCGHSHQASVVQQANVAGGMTWCVNPGSVGGLGAAPTWMLADLATFDFQIRALD